jgi:hypothetical protein
VKEFLVDFLLKNQNQDGSWGYIPAGRGAFEPTAYGLMCLAKEFAGKAALEKAHEFVRSQQNRDGGWPVNLADTESSAWVTALIGLGLLAAAGPAVTCQGAERFVFSSFGKMPKPWILRVADWMQSLDTSYVDRNYGGWSWNPATARWVEPTSYALLFLKKAAASGSGLGLAKDSAALLREAELLIYQRKCKDGGWNYGNSEGLGEALRPFPLTTALALLALQDQVGRSDVQEGLRYLEKAVDGERSALGLASVCLCFDIYSREKSQILAALTALFDQTRFFQNIKATALALLALQTQEGRNPFRIEADKRGDSDLRRKRNSLLADYVA